MRFTLGLTGLYRRFEGRVFSATEVARGKPAPDLFLHAAERMGVDPSACVVVEDSFHGVRAARAAGMRVFGYAGGLTPARRLEGPHTVIFEDMRQLPALLAGVSDDADRTDLGDCSFTGHRVATMRSVYPAEGTSAG